MPLALGIALVLAIVWTDSCKRHLWESLGPLHHFNCDCRGFRYYCRHDSAGNTFSFSVGPPDNVASSDRGTLDLTIVGVAGPKATRSFVAVQLGDVVQCTRSLSAANPAGSPGVYQELRLPLPPRIPRSLHIFLYGQNRLRSERLLAIAKVPLDVTRIFGLHDITVPFLNYEGVPAGQVRLVMRVGAPGSASLSTIDLIPYMAEESDMADDCCGGGNGRIEGQRPNHPIVVFSAGDKPSLAVPIADKTKELDAAPLDKDEGEVAEGKGTRAENESEADSEPGDSAESASVNGHLHASAQPMIGTTSLAADPQMGQAETSILMAAKGASEVR